MKIISSIFNDIVMNRSFYMILVSLIAGLEVNAMLHYIKEYIPMNDWQGLYIHIHCAHGVARISGLGSNCNGHMLKTYE